VLHKVLYKNFLSKIYHMLILKDAVGLSSFLSTTLGCPSVAEDPLSALGNVIYIRSEYVYYSCTILCILGTFINLLHFYLECLQNVPVDILERYCGTIIH
jgi:hypothetical protein